MLVRLKSQAMGVTLALGDQSNDLGCSEPSAELYHDNSTSFGAQGDSVADSDITNFRVESTDDVSDLESDEFSKTAYFVDWYIIIIYMYICLRYRTRDRRLL